MEQTPLQSPQAQQVDHFDSCFQVMASFIDALQKNFKEDTHYTYPLMPPQANIMFALDEEAALKMKSYMTALIQQDCGFKDEEFRFVERASSEAGGLYRLRLEFANGVTFDLIRRILEQTTLLEERVTQRKMAQ